MKIELNNYFIIKKIKKSISYYINKKPILRAKYYFDKNNFVIYVIFYINNNKFIIRNDLGNFKIYKHDKRIKKLDRRKKHNKNIYKELEKIALKLF